MDHTHIVKRRSGHTEAFDNHKVYASCYAACLNAHLQKGEAEKICSSVMGEVDSWVKSKETLSSQDIFEQVISAMKGQHEEAAFMYETHRDIS